MPAQQRERFLILAEGNLDINNAKTATSALRYRGDEVVAVVDSRHAGRPVREILGLDVPAPIVATLREGLQFQPSVLLIGIAPAGGQLPEPWRPILREAIAAGLDLVSGLHLFLADDPELAKLARERGTKLIDLRRPPETQRIAHGEAKKTRAKRMLTVGTDCNVGKMTVSLEIVAAAKRRGLDARFVPTGQTGMLIAGWGASIDRVVGDFMAGITEEMVLREGDSDLVCVEGQGSIMHPAYSGVTAALLHGTLPDTMILCHQADRTVMRSQSFRIPPLNDWIERYEALLAPLHRGRVVGVGINTHGLAEQEARDFVQRAGEETGLPATDVVRFGAEPLLRAILQSGLIAELPELPFPERRQYICAAPGFMASLGRKSVSRPHPVRGE